MDDDLREIVSKAKKGVNITFVCDACHTGTMLDHQSIVIEGDKKADGSAVPPEFKSREPSPTSVNPPSSEFTTLALACRTGASAFSRAISVCPLLCRSDGHAASPRPNP